MTRVKPVLFCVCVPLLFVNVLNMWRTFRLKSVMRVSAGGVKTSDEEIPGAYATFGVVAFPGRMRATSESGGELHVASGTVKDGSPLPALLTPTHALLP
jgi:hypothetical protein